MTRGRCGSLLLHRKGLAPSTPCRSPGASQMSSALSPRTDVGLAAQNCRRSIVMERRSLQCLLFASLAFNRNLETSEKCPCVDGSELARTFFTCAGLGQCSHV